MEIEFDDPDLKKVALDRQCTAGHGEAVDKGFRKVLTAIQAALDERDLYAHKSLHYEKLKGTRQHQRSLRINKQWRLVIELRKIDGRTWIGVISIEDYH